MPEPRGDRRAERNAASRCPIAAKKAKKAVSYIPGLSGWLSLT